MKQLKRLFLNYWPLFLITISSGLLFLSRLGRDLLWDWDECIYGQYAKEMKETGNFLTNQWNHVLGFEKPPLNAWLLQVPLLFGTNEFNLRILTVSFFLLLIVALYVFCKKYFSQPVAIMASLLLLTSEVIVIYSLKTNTDFGFSFFIFIACFFWIRSLKKSRASYLAGLFFGLAVMIKGLSATSFLLALFISVFINFRKEKLLNYFKMIMVFLAVIAPWHLYHLVTYGDRFIQVYILENIIQRANNPIEFHFEGRLFYVKLLYKNLFPWIFSIFILPLFYLINLKKYFNKKSFFKELKDKEILITVLLLFFIPFVSLTRIQTRLTWYAIPLFPFLSIFIAYSMEFLAKFFKREKWLVLIIIILAVIAGKTVLTEVKLQKTTRDYPPRHQVFLQAKKYPQEKIDYLVQFSERRARETLAPNLYTSTTWSYGGNTCALYYSDKKIQYYYSIKDFQARVGKKKGLYVIENGDLWTIKDQPVKILYRNSDFTLFEN